MTAHLLRFVEISARDRKRSGSTATLGKGDKVEIRVRRRSGEDRKMPLPREAVALVEAVLDRLMRGERVAVLAEDQELSPNDAAAILGISRPLVVHRMEVGDLPFRYVGKHRRARVSDVLALKAKLDKRRTALGALAEDTATLKRGHGL
jgi:hypothetical protein